MPTGAIPRYKVIHCRQSHKKSSNIIARIDRSKYPGWHVPAEVIIRKIMHHYKEKHPKKFKLSVAKSRKTRAGQMVRKATYARKK